MYEVEKKIVPEVTKIFFFRSTAVLFKYTVCKEDEKGFGSLALLQQLIFITHTHTHIYKHIYTYTERQTERERERERERKRKRERLRDQVLPSSDKKHFFLKSWF